MILPEPPPRLRLLIVDDEPGVLAALQRTLRNAMRDELQITIETDALHALELVRDVPFDIVISDLRMPEIDGVSLLSLVSVLRADSVRMILTGSADFATAQRAISDAGVFRYLTKPWLEAELLSHLRAAMQEACARREREANTLTLLPV